MSNDSRDSAVIDLRRLDKLWGKDEPRFFICHSAKDKLFARTVKQGLERNGIAAFVAHDDIEPTSDWRRDIEVALDTMDVLVAILTEDFSESDWTGTGSWLRPRAKQANHSGHNRHRPIRNDGQVSGIEWQEQDWTGLRQVHCFVLLETRLVR